MHKKEEGTKWKTKSDYTKKRADSIICLKELMSYKINLSDF